MAKRKDSLLIGAHMSIAGGIPRAVDRAVEAGCTVLQIFVKNSNRWKGRPLLDEEVREFREAYAASPLRHAVAHNSYLINPASPDPMLWRRSMEALLDELERSERLGLSHLVIHPGCHLGAGEQEGIRRVAQALDWVHERTSSWQVRIALETTAGQGTSVGCRFEHLRDILAGCRDPGRVSICMDTCHVFASGYDIRDEESYCRTTDEFDRVVGLDKIDIFHFNDSKKDFASRVDRHDHIGKGKIGTAGFAWILNDPRFQCVPKILETPKGEKDSLEEDKKNLAVLRSLARARRRVCSAVAGEA